MKPDFITLVIWACIILIAGTIAYDAIALYQLRHLWID